MFNVALFGTSADPPTAGHQVILSWLSQHYDWVAVWASDNPFKSHQTSLNHRMAMLQLLIDDIHPERQNVHVYPELSHSRTIYTLEIAQKRWVDARFTVVIGADLIYQLPKWYRAEEIFQQADVLIIPRPGYSIEESSLAELRRKGARVAIADLMGLETSSTAYRQRGDTEALIPPVEAYIHQEHLYSCQDVPREKQPIR